MLCRSRCPVPMSACPSLWALPCPLASVSRSVSCPSLARALSLQGVVVVGRGGAAVGRRWPTPGGEWPAPTGRELGAVGGVEALDHVPEEGLPCRLRHDGLRGGLVGVGRDAGADLLEGVHHVHPFLPSCSPGQLHPAAELLQGGGRPPGEVGGGPGGGEGSELEVLEWREEDVDVRRWGVAAPEGAGAVVGGLGVEHGYGRRGEREARWGSWGEGEGDMGRQWRAWRCLGERERLWRGLGLGDA